MKKSKIITPSSYIIALILEILPYGAVLNFANPEGDSFRKTYSYFSLTPYGYANFGPFLTACLTVALTVMSLFLLLRCGERLALAVRITSVISVITSLMPLMFGIEAFSLLGAFISALLVLGCVLSFIEGRELSK